MIFAVVYCHSKTLTLSLACHCLAALDSQPRRKGPSVEAMEHQGQHVYKRGEDVDVDVDVEVGMLDKADKAGGTAARGGYQTWIITMRIVLCFMLVAYHNHRIFDSYRHNISIEPFEWEDASWVRSMIKSTQRAILQAGLNVVCLPCTHAFLNPLQTLCLQSCLYSSISLSLSLERLVLHQMAHTADSFKLSASLIQALP